MNFAYVSLTGSFHVVHHKNYSADELDKIEKAIINSNIYKESLYETFVADVYVDFETLFHI